MYMEVLLTSLFKIEQLVEHHLVASWEVIHLQLL